MSDLPDDAPAFIGAALRLRALLEVWPPRLLRLDDAAAGARPGPGRWSPKEIVGHLVDSASNNHQRFVRAQFQDSLVFPPYDQDAWVAAQRHGEAPWSELVELWRSFNLQIARVMEAADELERSRPRSEHNLDRIGWGRFPTDRPATLDAFMDDYVGHLAHHLDQIPGVRTAAPPGRIESERLVIRRWDPVDAPLLRDAVDSSLEHLRPWMPWAHDEPSSLEETRWRMAVWRAQAEVGDDHFFGVFDADEGRVLGASGLHTRRGPDVFEIGYWIRADAVRRGFAREAARALTTAGLGVPGIERIEIRCDARNVASRRIPEALAFRLVDRLRDGDAETLVFATTRAEWGPATES